MKHGKDEGKTSDLELRLSTERLQLEPLVAAHASRMFEYLSDARLYRFHAGLPTSEKQLEERFRGWQSRKSPDGTQTWLNYAIIRKKDARYVGWVQATIAGDVATIGYDIFVPFWRQGYAKEACVELIRCLFGQRGIKLVAAVVDAENVPSIRLLEGLGFTRAWTGPSEDMPGRQDYRYELKRASDLPNVQPE